MRKVADKVFVVLCALCVLTFGIGIYALPKKSFSEKENRSLAAFPHISVKELADGSFSQGLGSFYTDSFPLREKLTELKGRCELLLGKLENNGVIFCEDGRVISKPEYTDLSLCKKNLLAIEDFCSSQRAQGRQAVFFMAPRSIDMFQSSLPRFFPYDREDVCFETARSLTPDIVMANDVLRQMSGDGERVWFESDHHWTSLGAYIGYTKVMEAYGDEDCMPRESFYEQVVSVDFYGSTASKAGDRNISPDTLSLMRYEGDGDHLIFDHDTKETYCGLYRYEYLDLRDKYSVFLGGNYGRVGIYRADGQERERLLVIKDSFANACVPFLAAHYDIEMIDLRYFKGRVSDVISEYEPQRILVLYGVQTVIDEASIAFIQR